MTLKETPRLHRILAGAEKHAIARGHNYLGTEHLLLALLDDQDGIASQLIREVGVIDSLRARANETLDSEAYATETPFPSED